MAFDLVGELESNLFSSFYGGLTDPLVGWLASFLDGGGNYQDIQVIENQLADITAAIASAVDQIQVMIDQAKMQQALTDYSFAAQPNKPVLSFPPFEQLFSDLTSVNLVVAAIDPPNVPATIPQLTNYVNKANCYSDQGATFLSVFNYFCNVQAALMSMMVEECHQGNGWPGGRSQTDPLWVPAPVNYSGAAYCAQTYHKYVQQQLSLLPFPNGLVGYPGNTDGLGVDRIVLQPLDAGSVLCWGYQNVKATYNHLQNISIQWAQNILGPDAWMLRFPAYAELQSLGALGSSQLMPSVYGYPEVPGSTLTPGGFDFESDVVDNRVPGNISLPCVSREALDEGSWVHSTDKDGNTNGWCCPLFFDVGANRPARVSFVCPWQGNAFDDIQQATAVYIYESSDGGDSWDLGPGQPSPDNYMDSIFIYEPTTTDPPLEEPLTMAITQGADNGSMTTMSLIGTFNRLQSNGQSVDVSIDISPYAYWQLLDGNGAAIDPSIAIISNNQPIGAVSTANVPAGTIVWGSNATASTQVTVCAYRRSQTPQTLVVNAGTGVAPTPYLANIFLDNDTVVPSPNEPITIQANIQILYSDGSTSPPPTLSAPVSSVNHLFQWVVSDPSICKPSSSNPNQSGIFVVSGGNAAGSFTISATCGELSVTATISVPAPAEQQQRV